VLFNAVVVYSDDCAEVDGRRYCLFNTSMTWDEARDFCNQTNMALPIVTDKTVSKNFHQFIANSTLNSISVDSSHDTTYSTTGENETSSSTAWFWLGLRARDDSSNATNWFWTNNKESGK